MAASLWVVVVVMWSSADETRSRGSSVPAFLGFGALCRGAVGVGAEPPPPRGGDPLLEGRGRREGGVAPGGGSVIRLPDDR